MRKSPKNLPEGVTPSGYSPWGALSSPSSAARCSPPERGATPGSTQATKQLPRHGLTAESVTPGVAWGEKKTDLPTNLKWQIGLFLWLKPYRGGCGAAAGGTGAKSVSLFARSPLGDSKGRSPWRAFGDFPRDGKVTRGGGAERPPHGGCGGRRPPQRGAQRGSAPRISSPQGPQGTSPPRKEI